MHLMDSWRCSDVMFGLPVGFGPFVVEGFPVGAGSPEVVRVSVGFCLKGIIFSD